LCLSLFISSSLSFSLSGFLLLLASISVSLRLLSFSFSFSPLYLFLSFYLSLSLSLSSALLRERKAWASSQDCRSLMHVDILLTTSISSPSVCLFVCVYECVCMSVCVCVCVCVCVSSNTQVEILSGLRAAVNNTASQGTCFLNGL